MRRNQSRRQIGSKADGGSSWISYSDMMAALLLLFVLVLCYSMYQSLSAIESKTLQLEEQQANLTAMTTQLEDRESELSRANLLLSSQQALLDEQAAGLSAKQAELDASSLALSEKEAQLSATRSKLDEQQTDLAKLQTRLDERQAELDSANAQLSSQQDQLEEQAAGLSAKEAALSDAQTQLAEQQALLSAQQKKLDDLVGVRTKIVKDLTAKLASNHINASVDPNTGDIMLESAVFFEYGKNVLTDSGKEFLRRFIPVYLSVLLNEENRDFLGEIIIEGHTDSSGSYISNLKLSQERALSVATYCLNMTELTRQQREALQSILTVTGKSYSSLIYNDDGTEDPEASRRVEFKFRLKDTEMIDEIRNILNGDEGAQP